MRRELCEFRWLHLPYDEVRAALLAEPVALLEPAATSGLRHSVTTLDAELAGLHLERRVEIEIDDPIDVGPPLPIVKLPMRWHAVEHAGLYPIMEAVLEAYPIARDRTQLSLQGTYEPPLGPVGAALDTLLLHRVAEVTVEHFLEGVAERLDADVRKEAEPAPLTEPE